MKLFLKILFLLFCLSCGADEKPTTNLQKELAQAKSRKLKAENLAVAMIDSAAKDETLANDEEFQERLRLVIKEAKGLELVIEATETQLSKKSK